MYAETYSVLNRTMRIRTRDETVAAYLRRAYGELSSTQPPAHDATIWASDGTPVVTFDDEVVALSEDEMTTTVHLAFYGSARLFRRLATAEGTVTAAYGCAVAIAGQGVAIFAPSGTGKTSLCLEVLRLGHRLYGDEMFLVRKSDGALLDFRQALMIRVKAGMRSLVPSQAFGDGIWADPLPLRAAVWLERGERSAIEPMARGALAAHAHFALLDRATTRERFWRFASLLKDVRCYRLTAATPRDAAELLCASVGA